MPDNSDYFRGYARDIGLNPEVAGFDNVQDALAGGGSSGVLLANAHLTAAQISTLFSSPTVLVPAPGANRMLRLIVATFELVAPFTAQDPATLAIYYSDGAGPQASGTLNGFFPGNAPGVSSVAAVGALVVNSQPPPGEATADVTDVPLVLACQMADPDEYGPIATASLDGGGLAYAVGDTGTIDNNAFGAAATYRVLTVAPVTGAVLTFTVVTVGAGYSVDDSPYTTTAAGAQPGIGTDLTINVDAVTIAGEVYVTALYQIVTTH